jgi:hypothetical protein
MTAIFGRQLRRLQLIWWHSTIVLCNWLSGPTSEKLGGAGRKRALSEFDWPKIFEQYQALWTELNARRLAVENNFDELAWLKHAPTVAPSRLDPSLWSLSDGTDRP